MNKVRRQRLADLCAGIEWLMAKVDEIYDEEVADACSCLEYASAYLSDAMDQVIAAMGD